MPIPTPPNTTCDIYRASNLFQAAVPIHLKAIYPQGLERGEGDSDTLKFTHCILFDQSIDIRDAYNAGTIGSTYDTLYIPDDTQTAWTVIFVEWVDLGYAWQHKRAYIVRQLPNYPTTAL